MSRKNGSNQMSFPINNSEMTLHLIILFLIVISTYEILDSTSTSINLIYDHEKFKKVAIFSSIMLFAIILTRIVRIIINI